MNLIKSVLFTLFLLGSSLTFAGPVNINTADAETLATELNGVGMKKAEAIIAFRENNGNFMAPDELIKVQGIGLATVEKNRDNIRVSDEG